MISLGIIASSHHHTPAATGPGRYPTGLSLWLKSDAITGLTNGVSVPTWNDSSSAGNNATSGTGTTYVTGAQNGLPIVRFGASGYFAATNAPAGVASQTVIAAVKAPASSGNIHTIFGSQGNGGMQARIEPGGQVGIVQQQIQNVGASAGTVTWGAWQVLVWQWVGGSYYITSVGTAELTSHATTLTPNANTANIGWNATNGSGREYLNSDLAEVGKWDVALTTTQITNVVADLKAKWGIA